MAILFQRGLSIDEGDITNTPTWQKQSIDSILDYSTNITFDDTNANVVYTSILKRTEDKICKDLIDSNIKIKPKEVLIFAITSATTSDIEWDFANGWSELF